MNKLGSSAAALRGKIRSLPMDGVRAAAKKYADRVTERMGTRADKGEVPFGDLAYKYRTGFMLNEVSHKDAAIAVFGGETSTSPLVHKAGKICDEETLRATAEELERRGFEIVTLFGGDEASGIVFRDPEFWPSLEGEPGLVQRIMRRVLDVDGVKRAGISPKHAHAAIRNYNEGPW